MYNIYKIGKMNVIFGYEYLFIYINVYWVFVGCWYGSGYRVWVVSLRIKFLFLGDLYFMEGVR